MSTSSSKWSEAKIGKALAHKLQQRSTLIVPNCYWTGSETDLLVIDKSLRIIDVEIKISRADLKADAKKDKWWKSRPWSRKATGPRQWPDKVWKHYYVMPEEIWEPKLLEAINPCSGVITIAQDERYNGGCRVDVKRAAKPCKEAKAISPADAIDLARLTSLRLWAQLTKDQQ